MSWTGLSQWWMREIETDPSYDEVVTPLLLEILEPERRAVYFDLGSGEGRVMRSVESTGAFSYGLERNETLAARSGRQAVVAELPDIPLRSGSIDGTYAVLVLEHLSDHISFFSEAARVVRSGGVLALVSNHPVWTAPGSSPIEDHDGEPLWRAGDYFSDGTTEIPTGGGPVTFHHRSMSNLLNTAADAGWSLQKMIERPHHKLENQMGIQRLWGCRWRLQI